MNPSIKHQTMKPFNITTNGITKLLKNLNPYKAQGPDNLSPRILKELADEISPLLQLIYTKSLDTGEVPADWRTANVSPVYKKGLKSAAVRSWSISLQETSCNMQKKTTFYIHYNMDFEKAVPVRHSSLNL